MRILNAQDFGAAIRLRRNELGYTQAYVAGFAGCSTVFLSELENGKPTVEFDRALRVATVLGIDLVASRRDGSEL